MFTRHSNISNDEDFSTPPTNLPYVVACVPAFQSERFISHTLDSVLKQDYPNIRVFISVDLCEDNTLNICRQYQQKHPQITLFQQSERQGWLNNTNFLFHQVEDPYFFYMQHDDVIQPEYVSRIMASLIEMSNAVLGYSDMTRHHYESPKRVEHFEQMDLKLNAKERVKALLGSPYWYVVFRGIVSLEAFQKNGPLKMNDGREFAADFIWLMKLAYHGQFVRVSQPLYDKFVLETSLAESWKKGWVKYFRMYQFASRSISGLPLPSLEKTDLICAAWLAFMKKVAIRLNHAIAGL
jgi:glycosyltransferase involved in cell wall biosynthesis